MKMRVFVRIAFVSVCAFLLVGVRCEAVDGSEAPEDVRSDDQSEQRKDAKASILPGKCIIEKLRLQRKLLAR